MSAPLTPDLSDASRCVSVHWSLPVQCVLPRTHRENWHEAWHPETGNRMRYRYTIGATEELHHGEWHDLKIPAPTPESSAEAEVARLSALVAAMHAAAVGETKPPLLGLVEDVASTRDAFEAQQARANILEGITRREQTWRKRYETENSELKARVAELTAEVQRLTGRYDVGISAVTEPRQTPTGLWRVRYRRDGRRKARTFPTHEQATQYAANARKGGDA